MRPCSPRPRLARSLPRPDSNSCIKALEILESSTALCTMSSWIGFHQNTFGGFFSFSVPLKSLDHSSFESKFFFPPWCVPWNPSAASQEKQRARHRSNPAWVPNVFSPKVNKKTSSADKCSSAAWIQAFLWSASAELQAFHTGRWPLRDDRDEPQIKPGQPVVFVIGFIATHGLGERIQAPCNDVLAGNLCALGILSSILRRSQALPRFLAGAVHCYISIQMDLKKLKCIN